MKNLLFHVAQTINNRRLIRAGEPLLVAVSGGADSMVLLALLRELAGEHRWRLVVAHFNHHLRGRASDADERLVQRTARALGLPCVCGGGNVKQHAAQNGCSVEMAARELRHAFLAQTARAHRCRVIALAHHQDDQAELFFLRLFRGTGAGGLSGMKWRNPSPADSQVQLVRPFLDVAKADLLAYAAANKIAFREDATNASTDILRNRIRHELLPLLEDRFCADVPGRAGRLMELLGAESELLDDLAGRWLKARRPAFGKLSVALQRRVVQAQLFPLGIAVSFDLVEQLRLSPGTPITVSPGLTVGRDAAGLVQTSQTERATFNPATLTVSLAKTRGASEFAHLRLAWLRQTERGGIRPTSPDTECFDAHCVGQVITLRHWQPGDRFQPIGLTHTVKFQDWFTDRKISQAEKRRLVVAVAEDGGVFWVEGQRIGEKYKLTSRTKCRLQWRWQQS